MYFNNETELNTNKNANSNIHIINRTSGKNCSTSSTDSGVGLVDNAATFRSSSMQFNDNNYKNNWQNDESTKHSQNATNSAQETKTEINGKQRISIEIEAKVNLNKSDTTEPSAKPTTTTTRKSSPAVSIRSTTISIVSIDENAIDSSCIDSDSEAESDEGCTVQKLGQQVTANNLPECAQLTQLNKGLTVISRQVMPGGSGADDPAAAVPSPDVVAKQLLNGNLNLATPTTPATPAQQIGSIALSNTTDVTFGDKHYYEGPVTIQQILIDSREKWKSADEEAAGQDNPSFNEQGGAANASGADRDNIGGGLVLRFVPRAAWLAQPPQKQLPGLSLPVPLVIVLATNSENCSTQAQCVFRVRFLQTFDIESQQRDDITFNFLIGGDGNVYVGRGWDLEGAHMRGYNTRSLSFAYIGSFRHQHPSSKQLNVTRLLLQEGVNLGKIAPNYKLVAASTLAPTITEYNAELLYQSFANWTHWSTA